MVQVLGGLVPPAAKTRQTVWVLGHLGFTLAKLGRVADARAVITELEKRGAEGLAPAVDIAVIHAGLGETDRALGALDRALASFAHSLLWINVDYRIDGLRSHPRFQALVKAIGLG